MKFQFFALLFALAGMTSTLSAQPPQTEQPTMKPVPVQSGIFIAPSNSRISFVGIHVGDDPKPRLGGFSKFQGYAFVEPSNLVVNSIVIDIKVDSVWTQFQKLTTHLKNADFFETDKFPDAKFVSTEIKHLRDGGTCQITGDLTLHGETKPISFPAKFRFENGGMVLNAKFQLDRSQFGMNQMLSGVDKMVEVELVIGQPTQESTAQPGHGGKSKKKQSSSTQPKQTRLVSLKLPNMT